MKFYEKGLAVVACAAIGAGFGYSEQNGNRDGARQKAATVEACIQNPDYQGAISTAVSNCLEGGIGGEGQIDSDIAHPGSPVSVVEGYAAGQRDEADHVDTGEIFGDAAIGAVAGVFFF